MDLWNLNYFWELSGNTWLKTDRLNKLIDNESIDSIDNVYFKFEKCTSGITYMYTSNTNNIYERNIRNGYYNYTKLFLNEYDTINEFMDNYHSVDFYIDENININDLLTKIGDEYLKSDHRIILTNQLNKIENDIYTFDENGKLIKEYDIQSIDTNYRYCVNVKLDNNNHIEFFLENDTNSTFPISTDEKDFILGQTSIIKHTFNYDTYSNTSKLWFTDYNIARTLNSDNNHQLYDSLIVPLPNNSIKIIYRNDISIFDISSSTTGYNGNFDWENNGSDTIISNINNYGNHCDINDYVNITINGSLNSEPYTIIFNTTIKNTNSGDIILNDQIPDYILNEMINLNISISNLNKINNLNSSISKLNDHYYGDFFNFSISSTNLVITPIYNKFNKYIDYGNFDFYFNNGNVNNVSSDNIYINYNLYNHLNMINSVVFNNTFKLFNNYTVNNFTVIPTYLIDDPSYPQQIVDSDSPLKIIFSSPSELSHFYKYTSVYINNNFDNKVFILDKGDDYIIIEKPIINVPSIDSITSFFTLTDISDILHEIYINNGQNYHIKDSDFIDKIYSTYNRLLSENDDIITLTTCTITPDQNNKICIKLFNYRNNENTLINSNYINNILYYNDENLNFKPIEYMDIGNDKLTMYPLFIMDNDIKIIDDNDNFITSIDIEQKVVENITLVNGLTFERLKIKYIWIYNATIKNAIIGEDEYGLVWYSGDWICGDWLDGTWYSGTWYNGTWRNGKWYSWLIDKIHLVTTHELIKKDDNKIYSLFKNGTWRNGDWYNGIFGDDNIISGYTSKVFLNHTNILPENMDVALWKNGIFHIGEFKNSIWENGVFMKGDMYGGYWKNGIWEYGTFNGNWWNGNFKGGIFNSGIWEDGEFIHSRFGYNNIQSSSTTTEWWDGSMNKSYVYAGLIEPISNNRTHFYNGILTDTYWNSGHFFTGIFSNSSFYKGVFGTYDIDVLNNNNIIIFENSKFVNGLWLDGVFKNSKFLNGLWLDGTFESGEMKTLNRKIDKRIVHFKSNTTDNKNKRSIL